MTRSRSGVGDANAVGSDDGQLLIRYQAGDAAAFTEVVARYRTRIYGYLVRCGVDAAARDDLFQEIFIRVHHAAPRYRTDLPLAPWLFTIAANLVRSHFRKERVRPLTVAETDAPELADRATDSHQISEAKETAAWVDKAIRALPLAQREVLLLSAVENLPQDDVAATLGIPVNTVKTHLRRARITLAQALARRNAALRRETSS